MSVLLIVRNYLLSLSRKKKNFLQILNDFFCYLVPYFIASALLYLFRDLPTFSASAPVFFVIFEMGLYKIAALNLFIISIIAILNGYKTVFRHSNENLLNIFSNPRTISTFIYFLILSSQQYIQVSILCINIRIFLPLVQMVLQFAILMYHRHMTGDFIFVDAFFDPVS